MNARTLRLEERFGWPNTTIQIDGKSFNRLKNYFELERFFINNPGERERLRKESQNNKPLTFDRTLQNKMKEIKRRK